MGDEVGFLLKKETLERKKERKKRAKKRGQITIFVILAIIIVVGIIAFFMLRAGIPPKEELEKLNPRQFIDKCVRDAVEPSIKKVLAGGGRIEPELYKLYQSQKYNYLCYQKNNYLPCINTHPMLKNVVKQEIEEDSEMKVRQCFNSLKQDLEDKGFTISEGQLDFSIELIPQVVLIKIDKKFDISRGKTAQSFEKFDSRILSPLYELIMIAREIVNQESQFCNFDYNGFMLLYPQWDITRIAYDESRIYHIKERRTGKEFKFAVRSCALPPGLF